MALTVTSATSGVVARPESRGEAIARVVREREAQASSSSAPEPQGQARAAVAAGSSGAVPQAAEQAPAAAPAAAPDHAHLVEIERRERALESARHEGELAKRELAALREKQAELKDWRKALAAGGHNVEDVVQEWLGGDSKPTDKAPAPAPKAGEHSGLSPELIARLEKLESKELEEQRGRARLAKRQSVLDLMPEGSEDFDATRNLGDGAIDMFLSYLEREESKRPEGIGPQETAKLLRDFEGATRKNLENDFSRLAKSKWARQAMAKLLADSESSASGAEAQPSVSFGRTEPDQQPSLNSSAKGIRPIGLSTEEIKTAARARLVAKWRQ